MSETRDFWSRRKARVAEEAEAEELAVEARAIEADQAEKTDEEILADLGLPDPDMLEPGDDFSGFMSKLVPDRIRSRALRKLWLTNPVLANVDGLVDYGEDFTDAACVIENLSTTYQVGKGMKAHVEEMARQAELEAAQEAEDEAPESDAVEPDGDEVDDDQLADLPDEDEDLTEPVLADAFEPDADHVPAPRRRMRFHFDDEKVASA